MARDTAWQGHKSSCVAADHHQEEKPVAAATATSAGGHHQEAESVASAPATSAGGHHQEAESVASAPATSAGGHPEAAKRSGICIASPSPSHAGASTLPAPFADAFQCVVKRPCAVNSEAPHRADLYVKVLRAVSLKGWDPSERSDAMRLLRVQHSRETMACRHSSSS